MRTAPFLLIVASLAFGLRVGFTVAYRGGLDAPPERSVAGADSVEYEQLARSVAAGDGYRWPDGTPTSFRAPGYPLALAAVYKLWGASYPAAFLAMAACGALTAVGTYFLARELAGAGVARWAAGVAAAYPGDVYACSYYFSESVFAPCLAFGLWAVATSARTGSLPAAGAAGLLLGYAALTRSFAVLFLPTFGVYLIGLPPARRGALAAVAFAAGFAACVAPWTYRNAVAQGQFVLIATNGGSTFYGANNDVVAGSPGQYGNWVATNRLAGRDLIEAQPDEVSHDKMEYRLGVEWVESHPEKFALLGVFKVARFWLPFVHYPSFKVYPEVNLAVTTPFLFLIATGVARTLRHRAGRRAFAVLHLTLAANLAMVVVFWGDPRFRDANTPILALYAALGLPAALTGRLSASA